MSRQTRHYHVGVDFPVYALAWLDDDHVAVTGGGGAGRSGIKNSLVSYVAEPPCKWYRKAPAILFA